MKILIIDDSDLHRDFLKKCITKAGYEVTGEAVDGQDGINKLIQT